MISKRNMSIIIYKHIVNKVKVKLSEHHVVVGNSRSNVQFFTFILPYIEFRSIPSHKKGIAVLKCFNVKIAKESMVVSSFQK